MKTQIFGFKSSIRIIGPFLLVAIGMCFASCSNRNNRLAMSGIFCGDLYCENKYAPMGVTNPNPVFAWKIFSSKSNVLQTAYQVMVADRPGNLSADSGNIWDSGKVLSNNSIQVSYKGLPLEPAKAYYWKVRVWDNEGNVSPWSESAQFATGLFDEKDWQGAQWIVYEVMPDSLKLFPGIHTHRGADAHLGNIALARTVIPYFRKEFTTRKRIKQAFIMASGLGHYELIINGKKIGDNFLAPGWTNYNESCLYNTFDVTKEIKKGGNAIGAIVGNGFYNINRERYKKLVIAYGHPTFICHLRIEYTDGSKEIIVSDQSWRTAPSPITFSSIFGGEDYDANLEQAGWDNAGFDDSAWNHAIVSKGPEGALKPETDYPMQVMQVFSSPEIFSLSDSIWIYDFGQNVSGIVKLSVKGEKGQTVRLWPGELLGTDSLVSQRSSGYPYYFQYTLKGDKEEVMIPRFTYYGFKYVQVEGAVPKGSPNPDRLPEISGLQMLHTRNASPTIGAFQCSSQLYNDVYSLIDWSIKSNLASVTTDCPHREKLGWLEVTHLMGPSINYIYDIHLLYKKIVSDMMESQTDSGLVPNIAPEYVKFIGFMRDSPEWGSSSVILPRHLYKWYGDMQTMGIAYPMMKAYVEYLLEKSDGFILSHGLGDWCDIVPGDRSPLPKLTPVTLTGTAILYHNITLMSMMADMLNLPDDAMYYSNLAEEVRLVFNKQFFDPQKKIYSTGSQTALAMPLFLGMIDKEYEYEVAANLANVVRDNKYVLTSGDVGFRYLLQSLAKYGYSQVIDSMISRSDVPGYAYQISQGATSLTEKWDASPASSNNHMMLGHLMEWLYSGLGGIRQSETSVAFREIIIEPQLVGEVSWCKTSFHAPYGLIQCDWKKDNGKFFIDLEIPCNTTASVIIPSPDNGEVLVNGSPIDNRRWTVHDEKTNKIVFHVGSGRYQVSVNHAGMK